MRFVPKEIKENVNISKISPIRDFFEVILKVVGILLLIYVFFGFLVDYIAPRISLKYEEKISKLFIGSAYNREQTDVEKKIQLVLDKLMQHARFIPEFNYKVYIIESQHRNAVALIGGKIIVLNSLLEDIESENELAMVLAHELGHFANRDHLRALGRGLIFLVISTFLFGTESNVSKFIANSILTTEMRFSQRQERKADIYGLDLLNKTYGHIGGALEFYEKMHKKEKLGKFFYIFSTHPYPKDRILMLKKRIKNYGYKIGEVVPLDVDLKQY